jgi:diamine N-acetyltransferase
VDDSLLEPVLNLVGERVALGPIQKSLLPLFHRWINDFEVVQGLTTGLRPLSIEMEQVWYDAAIKKSDSVYFVIYERETKQPIGITDLHNIDHVHGTAEFGIIIGEKSCWGRGYGTEVTALILEYGFKILDLHNIWLRVFSFNERARRAYLSAGFKEIGRLREAVRYCGKRYDVILMESLASEFRGRGVFDNLSSC